jgi:hypothetical protein
MVTTVRTELRVIECLLLGIKTPKTAAQLAAQYVFEDVRCDHCGAALTMNRLSLTHGEFCSFHCARSFA